MTPLFILDDFRGGYRASSQLSLIATYIVNTTHVHHPSKSPVIILGVELSFLHTVYVQTLTLEFELKRLLHIASMLQKFWDNEIVGEESESSRSNICFRSRDSVKNCYAHLTFHPNFECKSNSRLVYVIHSSISSLNTPLSSHSLFISLPFHLTPFSSHSLFISLPFHLTPFSSHSFACIEPCSVFVRT